MSFADIPQSTRQNRTNRAARSTRNYNADIDESLFGNAGRRVLSAGDDPSSSHDRNNTKHRPAHKTTTQRHQSAGAHGGASSSTFSASQLSALTGGASDGLLSPNSPVVDAAVISRTALAGLHALSSSDPRTVAQRQQAEMNSHKASLAAKSAARAKRMHQLTAEQEARAAAQGALNAHLEPWQEAELKERARQRNQASNALEEQHDDVKHMNQMMLYAQCVTIRDKQIAEKEQMLREQIAEDARLDALMEVQRLREILLAQDKEERRSQQHKAGKGVIVGQMAEREAVRLRDAEARQAEAVAMIERVKLAEQQEEQVRLRKKKEGALLLSNILAANHAQAAQKLTLKELERQEDERIAQYVREKDERQLASEQEAQRIRDAKEAEVHRLRSLQERAQDRRSEIDELRAKRYQEAKDREWRKRTLAEAQLRDAKRADMNESRLKQHEDKLSLLQHQARQERDEYNQIVAHQETQLALDSRKGEALHEASLRHKVQLQQQIADKEKRQREERARALEEGKHFGQQHAMDRAKLEAIKQEKLAQLEKMGHWIDRSKQQQRKDDN